MERGETFQGCGPPQASGSGPGSQPAGGAPAVPRRHQVLDRQPPMRDQDFPRSSDGSLRGRKAEAGCSSASSRVARRHRMAGIIRRGFEGLYCRGSDLPERR